MLELTYFENFRAGLDCYSMEDYACSVKHFIEFARDQFEKGRCLLSYPFWSFWNNLGNSFTKVGEYARAETCYTNAVKCFKNHKLMMDAGVVCFNYACMLFFHRKDPKDLFTAYMLFNLANRVGFKNIYAEKINDQFIKNARIYQESLTYFYKTRLFYVLKGYPQLRLT